jgi:hypothetical protein
MKKTQQTLSWGAMTLSLAILHLKFQRCDGLDDLVEVGELVLAGN